MDDLNGILSVGLVCATAVFFALMAWADHHQS